METRPDPAEARAALTAADAEEQATRFRPTPAWFSPALAAGIFVLLGLNAVNTEGAPWRPFVIIALLVVAAGIGAVVARAYSPAGYRGIRVQWVPSLLLGGAFALLPVTAALLAPVVGTWIWLPFATVASAIVLAIGLVSRKRQRSA